MRRITAGLGALILSAALLVGLPAALIFLAGNPIPSWDRLITALTMPDYGGEFLVGTVIPLIAWAAWATFAIGYLAEIPNQLRIATSGPGVKRMKLPGLGVQQKAAGVLIAAIIAIFAPNAAMAATPTAADVAPVSVSASVTSQTDQASAPAAETAPAAATAEQAPAAAQTYTVKAGDSLWAIAEQHLGDGQRYQEIVELNRDRPQPGGYTVGQRDGIDPGMVLELPDAAAAPASVTQTGEEQRTVVSGDTLWDIAADELGSGERYTEIYEASRDITQPDGRQISDPNLIVPGWTVAIPAADVAAAASITEAPTEAPAPVTPPAGVDGAQGATDDPAVDDAQGETDDAGSATNDTDEGVGSEGTSTTEDTADQTGGAGEASEPAAEPAEGAGTDTGLGFVTDDGAAEPAPQESTPAEAAPAPAEVDEAAEASDAPDWADVVTDWRTLGIGGVLAAGLLSFLGLRRVQQRRNRKPGQRIAMPAEQISTVELELRAVENPQGMDAVDHALRMLAVWAQDTGATLPALYALRLSAEEISVFLDEPAQLPAPFRQDTPDEMAWSIGFEDLAPLKRTPSAPYPALVTLGHDENDAHLLVDLEKLGSLNIDGTPELEEAALTALALELATSTWAENLQVTLVGVAAGLPDAVGSGRVRHVDDVDALIRDLRGQAEEVTAALEDAGITSLEQARTAGPLAESWTPEIIVLGQLPDEHTRLELAELVSRVPRVGIAAISAGHLAGGWNFRLQDRTTAELEIPDTDGATLPLTPQVVTAEEYARILALFTVANDQPAVEHSSASAEVELDEIFQGATDEAPYPEAETAELDPNGTAVDAVELPAEHLVDAVAVDAVDQGLDPADVAGETTTAEISVDDNAHDLSTLAPIVDLRSPRLQLLGPVTVLNPQGEAPSNAQQWNSQRLRAIELIAFVATHPEASTEQVHDALWPGSDPARGTSSRNRLTTAARRWLGKDRAGHSYLVPATKGVYALTDTFASDWDEWLALIGTDPTTATTENLVRALGLVKGQPISGVKEKYYVWAETLRQEMIASIGDAAHELATRSLREGNTRNARLASAIGRMVDPINEVFWRDALRAEHMAGDIAGVERLVTQLEHALTQIDPDYAEPEPETEELIEQLRRRHAVAS
ncbi:MAG: LysM peptidoglycan-binding domain-containing protein [Microbacterium sp.]|uniref:LysM peptidoglycan-binding domain-containing protein n=1 Tax=Microbacterium sp. TaxID=51671 RepID=UPI002726CF3F|nr:LysM peptidoglycan-binding domain-containing protein [Microbacterium sp.]MDO8383926.1 LysM peptidoglycan-binding domain-containing protein [Microbacterium sp.]